MSLVRASDGALLTNATGSDVIVNCVTVPDASAKEGKDFVFTNMHDLRISGDGNHSSANVYGVVLYSTDAAEKQVKLKIKSVTQPTGGNRSVFLMQKLRPSLRSVNKQILLPSGR